ncbi:MAG: glutamate ligase domain-containing protein, partial [Coprobacillaceae bacterium]
SIKDIKVVGDHNIQNIMIAICMAKVCHVKTEILTNVISSFIGVEHRIEFVREIDGIKIYNDSKATNTDASIIALKAFKQPVILLMGGFDKGLDLEEISTYHASIKKLITFGAAGERFQKDMHINNSVYAGDLQEATTLAMEEAEVGDIILLSPSTSSFDAYKSYEERGNVFKEIVNNYRR